MAMGRRGRDEAERSINNCRPFSNSTGSMRGTRGSTRDLGWLSNHPDKVLIKELLGRATYVVWSYDTPIGFVTEDETGNITKFYVDERHTLTTSHHQGTLRVAWREYETIGERRPARRPRREPVRQVSVDESNAMVREYAETARREPTAAHVYSAVAAQRRDAEIFADDRASLYEPTWDTSTAQMLDPRYADPDWVPGRDIEADYAAERRDRERVEREGTWRL